MTQTDADRRRAARNRTEACRERRRHGRVLVSVEVTPRQIAALERLALLEVSNRDRGALAWAISRYLEGAAHVNALGDALWPKAEQEQGRE